MFIQMTMNLYDFSTYLFTYFTSQLQPLPPFSQPHPNKPLLYHLLPFSSEKGELRHGYQPARHIQSQQDKCVPSHRGQTRRPITAITVSYRQTRRAKFMVMGLEPFKYDAFVLSMCSFHTVDCAFPPSTNN